jgi:hypothetical protein
VRILCPRHNQIRSWEGHFDSGGSEECIEDVAHLFCALLRNRSLQRSIERLFCAYILIEEVRPAKPPAEFFFGS